MSEEIQTILQQHNQDRTRLMDMLWDVQHQQGYISEQAIEQLAEGLNISPKDFLQQQIQDFRDEGLLGENLLGSKLSFDIRIQMGAGGVDLQHKVERFIALLGSTDAITTHLWYLFCQSSSMWCKSTG